MAVHRDGPAVVVVGSNDVERDDLVVAPATSPAFLVGLDGRRVRVSQSSAVGDKPVPLAELTPLEAREFAGLLLIAAEAVQPVRRRWWRRARGRF
jgi:hypothetical protein